MAANKKRVAVVGVGNMGKNHLRIYSEIPSVQIVAICDVNSELIQASALKYEVNAYSDFRKMLASESIESVSVCVPTFAHYEVARECIDRGVSVLLEKPIAESVERAIALLELSRKKGVKLLVGHIERFNPMVKRVKEIISRGQLGKVIAIITRRVGRFPPQMMDADVSTDLAIHDIDVCNYLLEELPLEVTKNGRKNLAKSGDDSVEFFMKYANGASCYVQANWVTPVKIRKLIITGDKAYLEADYVNQEIEVYQSLQSGETQATKIIPEKKEPLKEELLYFLGCLKDGVVIDSSFALESLKIALGS